MKRTCILLLMLTIALLNLTGCWSRKELSDIAITSSIGIDLAKEGYLVSVQIINPGEIVNGEGYDSPVTTYSAIGDTVFEAIRKITKEVPRKVYVSHLRMLILGEELAKQGISKVLDLLSRDHEFRTDFYIAVAKGTKAEEILNILTPLEKIPANKLFKSLEISERAWAATGSINLDELISDLISEGKHPVLTGIRILGNPGQGQDIESVQRTKESAILQYSGMGVFKNDRLIGWLDEEESKGYNYSQGKVFSTVVNISCPDGNGKIGIELIRTKTKMKGKMVKGKPHIDLEIIIEGNIGDVNCKQISLSNTQEIYSIERKAEENIKKKIEQTIHKAQKEYKADILGFGETIHRKDPKNWKDVKDHWDEVFEKAVVTINIDLKIRRIGTTGENFLKEIKE